NRPQRRNDRLFGGERAFAHAMICARGLKPVRSANASYSTRRQREQRAIPPAKSGCCGVGGEAWLSVFEDKVRACLLRIEPNQNRSPRGSEARTTESPRPRPKSEES